MRRNMAASYVDSFSRRKYKCSWSVSWAQQLSICYNFASLNTISAFSIREQAEGELIRWLKVSGKLQILWLHHETIQKINLLKSSPLWGDSRASALAKGWVPCVPLVASVHWPLSSEAGEGREQSYWYAETSESERLALIETLWKRGDALINR